MEKTTLIAAVAATVLGMGNAYAGSYDITHPLFTPDKGQFLSETGYHYYNYKWDCPSNHCDRVKLWTLSEKVSYGISDKFVVSLDGKRDFWRSSFNRKQDDETGGANTWGLALKYKMLADEKTYWDANIRYYQATGENIDKHESGTNMTKSYSISTTYGKNYQKVGTFYLTLGYDNAINYCGDNSGTFLAKLGWNKKLSPKWSVGADLDFAKGGDLLTKAFKESKNGKYTETALGWNVAYKIRKNMAAKVFGSFLLNDVAIKREEFKNGYSVGCAFLISF